MVGKRDANKKCADSKGGKIAKYENEEQVDLVGGMLHKVASFWWERLVRQDDDEDTIVLTPPEPPQTIYDELVMCDDLRCRFFSLQNSALDFLVDLVTDKRGMWTKLCANVNHVRQNGLPWAEEILCIHLLWGVINLASSVWMKVEHILEYVFGLIDSFMESLVFLVLGRWKDAFKKACLKRRKAKKAKTREADEDTGRVNATYRPSRDHKKENYKKAKGDGDGQRDEKQVSHRNVPEEQIAALVEQSVKDALQKESETRAFKCKEFQPQLRCKFCVSRGHSEEECRTKQRIALFNQKTSGQENEIGGSRKEQKEGAGPSNHGANTAGVANIKEDTTGATLLYTLIYINGYVFRKCLIDTGSEVNVMALKDATKYGIAFDPSAITQIIGSNGAKSLVEGVAMCDIVVAPCTKTINSQFIISSGSSGCPILGFPALNELGLTVNYK